MNVMNTVCILSCYFSDIHVRPLHNVLFIKIKIYKLYQGPQAV